MKGGDGMTPPGATASPLPTRRSLLRPWPILLAALSLVLLAALALAADWWFCLPEGETAEYVGRASCAGCHQEQTEQWAGSDHDLAMDPATPETVLGDFNNRQFTHGKVTSTMFRRDGQFMITTDGPTGALQTYPIKYVFGVWPLQQYLVEFPGGRIQCLPIAWDCVKKQWYHLYPNETIPHDDVLHWTRPLQNWNYMCAECHSTGLKKNYDLKTNSYHTTWSEIDVSCETCHGPGSLHVRLAESWRFFWDRRHGYGLWRLKGEDSRPEIETCAPCHARRRIVYPHEPAGQTLVDYPKFLDHYLPELIDSNLYYADGQILEEDYEYSSFLQSKMYAKGVRCSDCHDPHTLRVKSVARDAPRAQITDNRLCGQCHVPTTYDTPAHHHHPDAAKPGTLCVECHMPITKYMVVDPRRDHSLRVPRPDLTVSLKIPNACNGCHQDQAKGETPEWAAAQVEKWYGKKQGPPHFAYAIAAGREGKPEGQRLLDAVTRRKDLPGIIRASAATLLGRYDNPSALSAMSNLLEDPEPLVRIAAARGFEDTSVDRLAYYLSPLMHDPLRAVRVDRLAYYLSPLLHDPLRAVRVEAARLLTRAPRSAMSLDDQEAFDRALGEFLAGQKAVEDQAAAHLNIAVVYGNLGATAKAEEEYLTALRLDPRFAPARFNLGMHYHRQGKNDAAIEQYRRVIEQEPEMAEAHYSLGLLLAEDPKRLAEAADHLGKAAKLAPQRARIRYNHGLALQKLDRPAEAEQQLSSAFELNPSADHLYALAVLYAQQSQWAKALKCADELVRMCPDDRDFRAFLMHCRDQAGQPTAP